MKAMSQRFRERPSLSVSFLLFISLIFWCPFLMQRLLGWTSPLGMGSSIAGLLLLITVRGPRVPGFGAIASTTLAAIALTGALTDDPRWLGSRRIYSAFTSTADWTVFFNK